MKYIQIILLALLVIPLKSCKNDGSGPLRPNVSGRAGELVVVMNKNYWEGLPGELLRSSLGKEFQVLPQPEPAFDLVFIPPSAFNKTFQIARNIVIAKVGEAFPKNSFSVRKDYYANTQIIVELSAPNVDSLVYLMNQKSELIYEVFENRERSRTQIAYKRSLETSIVSSLKEKHHLSLIVPNNYTLAIDSGDFVWLRNEEVDFSLGIFIYEYPYIDPNNFTPEYLIEKRDAYLKEFVPGPTRGSYMTTEKRYTIDFAEYSYKKDRYIAVLRGLWKIEKGFMGGPFVSVSTLDEKRNRIITIEGYVFAPQLNKRNYVRQLEAILFSFDIEK